MLNADWIRSACKKDAITVLTIDGSPVARRLIEPIDEKRLDFIEGSCFDLAVENVFVMDGPVGEVPYSPHIDAFIGKDLRITPEYIEDLPKPTQIFYNDKEGNIAEKIESYVWTIPSFESRWLQSLEWVNIPLDVVCRVDFRMTIGRSGCIGFTAWAAPNYQGTIGVEAFNCTKYPIHIQRGARCISTRYFAFQRFVEVGMAKGTDAYQGVWQGKRETTNGTVERAY
jgi:deoxycytidine triphosphate deaminase